VAADCSRVRVEVSDGADGFPRRPNRCGQRRTARLHIVRALAEPGDRDAARPARQDGVVLVAPRRARCRLAPTAGAGAPPAWTSPASTRSVRDPCRQRHRKRPPRRPGRERAGLAGPGGPHGASTSLRDAVVATDDKARSATSTGRRGAPWLVRCGTLVVRPVFDLVPDSLTPPSVTTTGRSSTRSLEPARPALDVDIKGRERHRRPHRVGHQHLSTPLAGLVSSASSGPVTRRSSSAGPN